MNILIILLYILGTLLLLLLLLLFFVLVVPFRYRVEGGYRNRPWAGFNLRCSPAFILDGTWGKGENEDVQAKLILFGIPFKINLQNTEKKEQTRKEKKESKKKNLPSLLTVLDRDLRARGLTLVKDLLAILKPDQFNFKGKIGFEEPHLTGWLATITKSLEYCCEQTWIDIEPVWGDEYYEFESLIIGRVRVGLILIKVGWFLLVNRVKQAFTRGKKQLPSAA